MQLPRVSGLPVTVSDPIGFPNDEIPVVPPIHFFAPLNEQDENNSSSYKPPGKEESFFM